MAGELSVVYRQLSVTAEIGEIFVGNVSGFTSTFAINTIPSATITLATGRDIENLSPSVIQDSGILSGTPLPVKVWAQWIDIDNAVYRQLLFEGDTAGAGWNRTANNSNFVIYLKHWLADLNYASALSASIHPGSPGNLTYPAVEQIVRIDATSGGVGSDGTPEEDRRGWVAKVVASDSTTLTALQTDLWDEILLKFLKQLATADPFDKRLKGLDSNAETQARVLAALNRMQRVTPARIAANIDVGAPLAFNFINADGTNRVDGISAVVAGITADLQSQAGQSFAHTSMWGKIIGEYAPNYLFEVVPLVSNALVVPNAGALRSPVWITLTGDEQMHVELSGTLEQPLQAVSILHPNEDTTGISSSDTPPTVGVGGSFGFYKGDSRGIIMFKSVPSWLASGLRGDGLDATTPRDPEAGKNETSQTSIDERETPTEDEVNNNSAAKLAAKLIDGANLASAYARQLYISEMLKSRAGSLTGPLRYDVAPGSQIRIQAPDELIPGTPQGESSDFIAKVVQVTTVIDAQDASAATTFTLTHCRTAAEDALDNFSSAAPALYKAGWRGGELSTPERII